MNLDSITVLILTHNEQANLSSTLECLTWAKQILIVDSGSTDGTLSITKNHGNTEVIFREFDHFGDQCNFGLAHIENEWVLSIDADYKCPSSLREELIALDGSAAGYRAKFTYMVYGKPLRSTLYPPRCVLYRKAAAVYQRDGHAHRVRIEGQVGDLQSVIVHDDWKSMTTWLSSQVRYAKMEAEKIMSVPAKELALKDRLRRGCVFAAPLNLFYCLFAKRLILDGWAGIFYSMQRTYAELLLSLFLLDRRLRDRS